MNEVCFEVARGLQVVSTFPPLWQLVQEMSKVFHACNFHQHDSYFEWPHMSGPNYPSMCHLTPDV